MGEAPTTATDTGSKSGLSEAAVKVRLCRIRRKMRNTLTRYLARRTGGNAYFPRRARELSGFYDRVADELKHQYSIYYSSSNQRRDGAWRRILVSVPGRDVTVKAREGYYALR